MRVLKPGFRVWYTTGNSIVLNVTQRGNVLYYLINDDAIIEGFLSGRFTGTPDGHAVYVRYPLSWLLSQLYALLPGIPWYGVFLLCCYVFAFGIFGYVCYKKLGKRYFCGLGFMAAAAFLLLPNVITVHYTVATAALAAGAMMLTLGEGPVWLTAFSIGLCYCLRKEVFLLAIPFWGVVVLWKFLKKPHRRYGYLVLAAFGITIVFAGINSLAYRGDNWKEFKRYNDARTQIYDYEWFLPYEQYTEAYEAQGVSEREYALIASYELMLDGSLTVEDFEKVLAVNQENASVDTPLDTVKAMLIEYADWILHPTEAYTWIAIALYVLLLAVLLMRRAWLHSLLVLCLCLGRSAIWVYLFVKGRFPEHVMLSLFVLELTALLGFALEEVAGSSEGRARRAATILCAMFVIGFGFGTLLYSAKAAGKQVEQHWKWKGFEPLQEYFEEHSQDVYLMDIASMWDSGQRIFENGSRPQNYFLAGGWASGSPLVSQRFDLMGAVDGADALLHLENVHYVVTEYRDYDWLEFYLGEPVKQVEQIGGYKILSWH